MSALTWAIVNSKKQEVKGIETINAPNKGKKKVKQNKKSDQMENMKEGNSEKLELKKKVKLESKKIEEIKKGKPEVDINISEDKVATSPTLKKRKKSKVSASSLPSELSRKMTSSLDKVTNSPSASELLLPNSPIAPQGIKFSSSDAFLRFLGLPGKRGKKRSRQSTDAGELEGGGETTVLEDQMSVEPEVPSDGGEQLEGEENHAFTAETPQREEEGAAPGKRRQGLDLGRLRHHLATQHGASSTTQPSVPVVDSARQRLSASRFRFLNEQLYTQEGSASASLFRSDPSLFQSYHEGFQLQASQWPLDPLDLIIADIKKLPNTSVIADLGCGEARLAGSVPNRVHSFDLVAVNERVVACDIAKLPLEGGAVDCAVFCLALMGTNTRDFVFEAARVLRVGGKLKVAELESRFQGQECSVDTFIADVEKFGFKNTWKDLKKDFFYFLDFQKVKDVKKKKKLPEIELKPCLYKKR